MTPTGSDKHRESTAGEPISAEVIRNVPLIQSTSVKADTSAPPSGKEQRVPSSGGEGNIWLRCRVRQGRLGSGESSTR